MDKAKGKNHHEVCWSCGKMTMKPANIGSVCTNCGATYCDVAAGGGRRKVDDVGVRLYDEKSKQPGEYCEGR
jgi:hypothetical protein